MLLRVIDVWEKGLSIAEPVAEMGRCGYLKSVRSVQEKERFHVRNVLCAVVEE